MALGWGDFDNIKNYPTKEEINKGLQIMYGDNKKHFNDTLALYKFAYDIKEGDIVFTKRGIREIIGKGTVKSDYMYDSTKDYPHIRKVKWTHKGDWNYSEEFNSKLAMKTLTDITPYNGLIRNINTLLGDDETEDTYQIPKYSPEEFLKDVYISEDEYETIKNLLKYKKNLILQGAPGVGKTFMSKRLAYSIMGEKNLDRVQMVQFHQSYSYEDFIMGFRPTKDGFKLKNGTFYTFCKKAEMDNENKYFFIIDEINRGNLNKIFW